MEAGAGTVRLAQRVAEGEDFSDACRNRPRSRDIRSARNDAAL
jgi:hypothetical protein